MDKKVVVTIAAFALPLAVLAILVGSAAQQNTPKNVKPAAVAGNQNPLPPAKQLENDIKGVKNRLQQLQSMTQADWDAEGKKMGDAAKNRAPSLEEARKRNADRLAVLQAMTPEQYMASNNPKSKTPEQQLTDARQGVKSRLEALNKMTQADWEAEGKKMPPADAAKRAPTLEIAKKNQTARLAQLEKMTPEQFAAEQEAAKKAQAAAAQQPAAKDTKPAAAPAAKAEKPTATLAPAKKKAAAKKPEAESSEE